MRAHKVWWVLATLWLYGCPGPSTSDPPEMGSKDMTVVEDVTPDVPEDMGRDADASPDQDVTPDMPEGPCAQGYTLAEDGVCKAALLRRCDDASVCRVGETCDSFELSSGKMIGVCMFDPTSLKLKTCPGSPGCASSGDGVLLAGAASKVVTPQGFETPTPEGLDGSQLNFGPSVVDGKWNDCGYDGLCPGDEGYTAPDEGEGDGEMQGAWLAGFTFGRPAQYCEPERIGCDRPECCVSKWAHDDMMVQIAVVRQGDVTVAFASIDAVGFFHTDVERIRREVEESADVDLLVMASTHNHEAPDTVGQWGPGAGLPSKTGRDPRHMAWIRDQTVAGIQEAVAGLEPATVFAGVVDRGVDGLGMNDSRVPFIIDDNIPVVRLVAKEGGATIATMLSLGLHPEVLWSGNVNITSDYGHFARKYITGGLEAVTEEGGAQVKPAIPGTGGVTVMFSGALGGLIYPRGAEAKGYDDQPISELGWDKADAVGQRIAYNVLTAISEEGGLTELTGATLRYATRRFLTPIENPIFLLAALNLRIFERDIYNSTRIGTSNYVPDKPRVMSQTAAVSLGPLTFFTAPGEVFPELLVGGYPGKPRFQDPQVGDIESIQYALICDVDGLPSMDDAGTFPCIIRPEQVNPPDFAQAPDGPYMYNEAPGQIPFFIGLGMDFLGYMVPPYDFKFENGEVPGDHYEETNSASGSLVPDWQAALMSCFEALR